MNSIFSIILAVGIVLGLLFGIHLVVYKALVALFQVTSAAHLLWLKVSLGILGLSFIAASLISSRFNTGLTRLLYTGSAVWTGLLAFLFLAACLYFVSAIFLGGHPEQLMLVGKVLFALALLVGAYGVYHAGDIVIKPVTVKLADLPESWKGRKAVFVSDVHLGQVRGAAFAGRVVDEIAKINPDVIFNTGDLYDGVKVDPAAIIEPFRKLNPPLGSYFVMGNHEEFRDNSGYAAAIRDANMHILDNEVALVDGMRVAGVDYLATTDKTAFTEVMDAMLKDESRPTILLKHVPVHLDIAEAAGVDLQLSGHTHKAQIFPLSLITRIIYKGYDYGLKPFRNMQMLTTSGVGTWGPPLRVGSDAEIVVITFE